MGAFGQVSEGSYSSLHLYKGLRPELESRFPPNKLGVSTILGDNRVSGESNFLLYPSVAGSEICPGIAQSSPLSVPLLAHVLGAEGLQLTKTNYGPLPSQSFALQEALQNGRPEEDQQMHPTGPMGGEIRPEGCLLAPPSGKGYPSPLRLCPGGSSVSLSKASIRFVHGSVGLHSGSQARQEGIKIGRGESNIFYR